MKIKVKKQLNLLDLIEHIKNKNIVSKVFDNTKKRGSVIVSIEGNISIYAVSLSDTFTVEVEEGITEDTIIPKLIEVCEYNGELTPTIYFEHSIKRVLEFEGIYATHKAFYMLNDDMTMTLIWKDGEIVK